MAEQSKNVQYLLPAQERGIFTDLDRLFEQILRQDDADMSIAATELLARVASEEQDLGFDGDDAA